jgi:acyl-[acyl-carrier-protein]-phospholipid O-acyltransferase/long-chain-fatty-acid--[acyl-carrier-protein] ligase
MSSSLLMTRRFAPLFWTQFFSAFSDNFLRTALVFLILFHVGGSDAEALITFAAAVFITPYFFLSALGGELADRYDKAKVAQRLKLTEIGIALIAVVGFSLHSVVLLFIALFLFGVIAALFGPIKYGILPDHLARSELPAGNALVQGATFIAILLGIIVGGMAEDGGNRPHLAFLVILFSLLCWGASLFIPGTGQGAPDLQLQKNVLVSTIGLLKFLREDPRLWWGALVSSWFNLVGAVSLSLIPALVKDVLGGNEEVVTTCLAIFAISIAVGSRLAAWLAAGRIILLPTVIGAVLLGAFAIDLGASTLGAPPIPGLEGYLAAFTNGRGIRLAFDLAGLAIAGGLLIVPAGAAVQAWAGADRRARVVAAVNVLSAASVAGSLVIVAMLQTAGMTTSQLFLLLGAASLVVVIAVGRTMPASALSDALSIIYRALFRMEVKGIDNLSKAGSNRIIALNHVSFLDPGLALSLLNNKPVFAIDVGIAKLRWVRPFVMLTNAMQLDPLKPMAVRSLIEAVKAGNPLVIFPEGRITVTGNLMKVYHGAGLVADKANAEIVPVRIEGLEQTPFSRLKRGQVRRRWFPKVRVTILEPVKLTVDPELKGRKRRLAAGTALYGIMSDLVFRTTSVEGWPDTDDIVAIDEQGFLTTKGCARRFAKAGGEMISPAAVEALAAELWPNALSAAVAVPDPRRDEGLILLTQQKGATRADFQSFARAKHASDLMIPSEVWVLDNFPVLATGEADMIAVGKLVEERLAAKSDTMARAGA